MILSRNITNSYLEVSRGKMVIDRDLWIEYVCIHILETILYIARVVKSLLYLKSIG